MTYFYKNFLLALFVMGLGSCRIQKSQRKIQAGIVEKTTALRNHIGVQVIELESGKKLFGSNENALFVPASNIKIFTLASAIKHLPDSLVAFQFKKENTKSVCIKGMHDPSFLNPYFDNSKNLRFFNQYKTVTIDTSINVFPKLGMGWAWEDYQEDYQTEITPFPAYGNLIRIKNEAGRISSVPSTFEKNISHNVSLNEPMRDWAGNVFSIPKKDLDWVAPYVWTYRVIKDVLSDAIKKEVKLGQCGDGQWINHYNTPRDTVLRKMMFDSDNTIAEQTVLQCTNATNTAAACAMLQKEIIGNAPTRWVDGSGLSRYNLSSPNAIIQVLKSIVDSLGFNKTVRFFAQSGTAGTLKNLQEREIWAKSGSMGGMYNQSGYLISAKGKKLAFSVLSNNSTASISEIKKATLAIIDSIYQSF